MIRTRSAAVLGALFLGASFSAANAGGLYGSYAGSTKDLYVPQPTMESTPRFYLRVDGAYGEYDKPIMVENGIYDLFDEKIESGWGFGGGVGYYFTQNFRGDVTVERRFETEARGSLLDTASGIAGVRSFGLESTMVMFNLYYDFDNRSSFTPYIGAGLGVTINDTTEGSVALNQGGVGTIAGESKTEAAGALMAGVSVALLDNVHFDAGYRFLYLGSATTGPLVATPTGGAAVRSDDPTVEDIHAHEIKFGLRYDWN